MLGIEYKAHLDLDITAMDHRLKIWGHWCRSGGLNPALWESDNEFGRKLTTYENNDSAKLQLMVMRLPILHRMTIQVHYVDRGNNKETGERKKWREVNTRMRKAGEFKRISERDYPELLWRAWRIIVNSERFAKGETK